MTAVHEPESRSRGVAGRREFVAIVTTMMAMAAMAIDLMMPTFADLRVDYGLAPDDGRVGWVVTSFFFGLALGPWLYGPASDRFGRRAPLFAGLALYLVCSLAAAFAPSLGAMLVIRFIWGLGAGASRVLSMALVRDRYEGDTMARLMSLIMAVFLLVPILAPAFGALVNAVAPWRVVFGLPAVLAAALMIWCRRLPETLPVERRRPLTRQALRGAVRASANPVTVYSTVGVMFLFGVMTSYLSSFELILHGTYDRSGLFPVLFGAIGVLLALASLANARTVRLVGLVALLRRVSSIGLVTSALFIMMAWLGDGVPPLWLLMLALSLVVPVVQGLVPNGNTLAMQPVPHVAGTASALIGTITTGGGATISIIVTSAYDGTARPLATGIMICMITGWIFLRLATTAARSMPQPGSQPV
jgi:DHA1 family bicyclomycin/chloramphenicol resistance-like MFS transporter